MALAKFSAHTTATWNSIRCWIDNDTRVAEGAPQTGIDWTRVAPFVALHLSCLAVFAVGVSATAMAVAAALYALRMFAITGFYHRYFAHAAFGTSRPAQFVFAFLGASSAQRGPLWWATPEAHPIQTSGQNWQSCCWGNEPPHPQARNLTL